MLRSQPYTVEALLRNPFDVMPTDELVALLRTTRERGQPGHSHHWLYDRNFHKGLADYLRDQRGVIVPGGN